MDLTKLSVWEAIWVSLCGVCGLIVGSACVFVILLFVFDQN